MEINQQHLEDQISELEKGYVISLVELIKIPVFRKAIERDLASPNTNKARKKSLEDTLELNKKNESGHKDSLKNVEEILTEVYKLRK